MPRFCANLTLLFADLPLAERISAAARTGFEAVEILFPYEADIGAIGGALRAAALPLALINTPVAAAGRGLAGVPGAEAGFRAGFRQALDWARTLGAGYIHVMSGLAEGAEAEATLRRNLRWAAAEAPDQSLTIEPINPIDIPGYLLSDFDLALDVIDAVDVPNLRLQFDAYHAHRITGDVAATWAAVRDQVVHVQVAGFPGRHEPSGGEIDYAAFFAMLDRDGYRGWVSGEYHPAATTQDGLGWLRG